MKYEPTIMKLKDLCIGGKGKYGIPASAVPYNKKLYTYLRITDITDDGRINKSGLVSVDEEKAGEYLLQPNDIVFARTGGSTGRNYFYDGSDGEFVYAGFLIKFSIDPNCVNPKYVKYYCQSKQYRNWVNSFNTGSTRGNINAQTYANMELSVPCRKQQDLLVDTLSVLDDKIELNNKINENLERQAQAIYQEWFGNIEEANKQGTISDICLYSKDRVAVSKLDVNNYFSTENMLPEKAGVTEASSLPTTAQTTACHVGDTLISNIRPYFKKITYCYEKCGCSTDVLCFVPIRPKYSAYLYSTLYADRFFDFMVAGSKGTKMPRGDKQQIMTYPVALPTDTELDRFNEVVNPMLTQIYNNFSENKRLSLLRDTLLPKLMNGEIDVEDVSI